MRRAVLFLLLIALVCFPVTAQSFPKGITKHATVEGITEYRLDNGLQILLFPDPSKPKVTINMTYMVGSRHEGYGEKGMAHLLEHLLFKGTPRFPKIMQLLKDRGAPFNGTTSLDRTNYFETLNSTDDNLRWALEMEADRMVNSSVARSDLDTEMTVVRNEFEMGENSPMRVLLQRVMSSAFVFHNYGKPTIGSRSDIENVPIERLQAFYRKHYQPDNAMLVITGKFDEAKALGWVAEYFGRIPKPSRAMEKLYTQEPVQDGERVVSVRRTGDVQIAFTAFHVPAGTHPDFPAISVLELILGDSPSGRLYKSLVDSKKASRVYGFDFQQADPGLLFFGAEVRKEQSLDQAKSDMLATIESVVKEPPSSDEVERAKTRIAKEIELHLANSERVGLDLSEWASMGDWRMLFLFRDGIRNVKPEDVQRVARTYLKADNRTVGLFLPVDKPDRAEIPKAPDVVSLVKDYKGTETIAQGEAFDPSPANIDNRTRRLTLPNGMKVVSLAKKNRGESVTARITVRYGDEKSLRGRETEATFAWRMLMRGTAKHNRQQLQDELDKLKARVNTDGGWESGSLDITTTRPNLKAVLNLAAEILRSPAFPESEFEQVRQSALAAAESQRSQPQFLAMLELRRHLYPYPKGDLRYVQTSEEKIADLKRVTLDGVRKFYHAFFGGSSSSVVALVGDFDPAVTDTIRDLIGDWKTPLPVARVARKYHPVPAVNKVIETPDKANAMFAAGLMLPLSDEHPDNAAMVLANSIFGSGTGRMFKRMREKEGWSYGAYSIYHGLPKDDDGNFVAYAILAPQNMSKVEAAFGEEMRKVIADGFDPDEFEKAKSSWLQQQAVGRAQDGALLNLLSANEYWGRTGAFQSRLEAQVAALSLDQVNAVFRKYLKPEAMSIFKAGDFKKAVAP